MNTETTFDFYYGDKGDQFSFCRIPRQLITRDAFNGLSTDAKLLYALMLERMGLSARNGWHDELDRIYIYFTVNEIRVTLNCGNDKAIKLLAELDTVKGIGLIERVKQGQGKPTKIFVKNFSKQIVPQENGPAFVLEDGTLDSQAQNCEESAALTAEKSRPRVRKNRSQDIGKTECNYIDMNYTYLSYINPSIYQGQGAAWSGHISTKVTNTAKQNLIYELNQPERENFNSESGPEPRTGRQRRLWRRCHSKYGILTAKFHLLGAPPLIPPKNEAVEWHTTIRAGEKSPACWMFPPLGRECNPPSAPRQGRVSAYAAAREPASLRTGRALTGTARRIYEWVRGGNPAPAQGRRLLSAWKGGTSQAGRTTPQCTPIWGVLFFKKQNSHKSVGEK